MDIGLCVEFWFCIAFIAQSTTNGNFRLCGSQLIKVWSCPHLSSVRNWWMSQQSSTAKPSLQGVRIKARKGAVKAQAKHEPIGLQIAWYQSQMPTDFSSSSLQRSIIQAPWNCNARRLWRFRHETRASRFHARIPQICRYLVWSYTRRRPSSTWGELPWRRTELTVHNYQCKIPSTSWRDKIVRWSSSEATQKVRLAIWTNLIPVHCASRYKYLQKPLEESSLPTLFQYINRWSTEQNEKLATAVGLLLSQGLAGASCLQSLTKEHLVKNGWFMTSP